MKAGWRTALLSEVCLKITQGPNPKYDGITNPAFGVLKTKDVYDDVIHYDKADRVSENVFTDHPSARLQAGDVLLAIVGQGSINKCNVFQPQRGTEFIFTRALGLLRPSPKALDPFFLRYFLQSSAGKASVDAGIGGASGQQVVTTTHLKSLPIPLPPLDEQKRIVAVLDEAFEGLSRARANAEANLADARELFERILNERFTEIQKTAPLHRLSEMASYFGRGKSRHRPRNDPRLYGGDYPFVQTGDIRNSDGVVTQYSQTYNAEGLAQSKLWPAGTVCITIAANIAETAVLGFDSCFPDSVVGMVCDPKKADAEYVEFMLRHFAATLKAMGKGSAQDNINLATFEGSTFPFPTLDVQRRVASDLIELAALRNSLAASYSADVDHLDTLRQSLLQKAFSGELT